MATLTIDLQAGFAEDHVVVSVDGEAAVKFNQVSTDYSIGRAAAAEVEVTPGPHTIEITVPGRRLSTSRSLEIEDPLYLACSIAEAGQMNVRVSDEPFIYF